MDSRRRPIPGIIVEFIARDEAEADFRILQRMCKAASGLERIPSRGRIVPELEEFGLRIYREILTPLGRIIYRLASVEGGALKVVLGYHHREV